MPSVEAILQAASTLSSIELETQGLLIHRKELETAFYKLQTLLEQETTPPPNHGQDTAPVVVVSSVESNSLASDSPLSRRNRTISRCRPLPDQIDNDSSPSCEMERNPATPVLKRLERSKKGILKHIYQREHLAISSRTDWTTEDPRVVDTILTSKNRSDHVRFRAGLSQCSLADDYDRWERTAYNTSRISTLVLDLKTAEDRKSSHVQEYLDANADRFMDTAATKRAIEHGIKCRVFQTRYGQPGVLAFLYFVYREFRDLSYQYFPNLEALIRNSEWRGHAESKSTWLDNCQTYHNFRYKQLSGWKHTLEPASTNEQNKRPRLENTDAQGVIENLIASDNFNIETTSGTARTTDNNSEHHPPQTMTQPAPFEDSNPEHYLDDILGDPVQTVSDFIQEFNPGEHIYDEVDITQNRSSSFFSSFPQLSTIVCVP